MENNNNNKTEKKTEWTRGPAQCLMDPKEEMASLRSSRLVESNEGGCFTDGSAGDSSLFRVSFLAWTWKREETGEE